MTRTNMTRGPNNHSEADVNMRDVEMCDGEEENIRPRDERNNNPLPLPTQRIFLSYSGSQKSFVEQLYWDLKRCGHTPFFDESPESLPKGKAFPERIKQAASQCVVAVVVLSDEYFMSRWPMLELVAFVDAQRTCNPELHILPLFYKLDVCDLKDDASIQKWTAKWQNLAAVDARINPGNCEDALRVLSRSNGEKFSKYGKSEFKYREAIVSGLYQLSRPYTKYGTPPMVGRIRLCQKIGGELERQSQVNGGRRAALGLYGLGGMGKTLLCKALCNHFREEYAGRVCHVECLKSYERLELQKMILDELTDYKDLVPFIKSSEEAIMYKLKEHLPRQAVFLAVDNVQDGDLQWLQSILNCAHHPKSKFVVTSRCSVSVQSVLMDKDLCWAIPSLTENEALELFVRSAVPTPRLKIPRSYFADQQGNRKILRECIRECFFSNDVQDSCSPSYNSGGHYSPMLLQTVGSSIKEADVFKPQDLIEKCRMRGKLQHFHKHKVFDFLREDYDALPHQRYKLMFLDIALFAPRGKLRKLDELCIWLEEMHDLSREDILHMLKMLRKKSLVEDWEANSESQITLHDLFKEFASYELRVVEEDKRWAVYHKGGLSDLPQNLEKSPPGRIWPKLARVYLRVENQLPGAELPGAGHLQPDLHVLQSIVLASPPVMFPTRKKIQQWKNVQLLCLEGFESQVLDISPLTCLRSLKLISYELRTLKGCNKLTQLRFVKLNCSGLREGLDFSTCSKLQELVIGQTYSLQELHLPRSSTELKIFKFTGWNEFLPPVLDLGNLTGLREVAITHTIWDAGRASSWGNWRLSITGLQFLTRLVGLTLIDLPISSLPGLEKLVGLEFLILRGCAKLSVLPDLSNFSRLAWVDRHGCEKLPPKQPLVSRGCMYKDTFEERR